MPKKKNRRRERRHVLDVKLSSNQIRRRRAQFLVSALFAVAFLTLTIYGLWRGGWWAAQRFVYHNEQLRIRNFEVRTDGVIDTSHLRRWAGVKPDDNLFAVDLGAIKRRLEMNGMIRQASLDRVLPGTLRLQVNEREPVARVRLRFSTAGGRLQTREFGLDRTGRVMPLDASIVRPETVQVWQRLAVLTGINEREIIPGNEVTNRLAHAALNLIAVFNTSAMSGQVTLTGIDVSQPEVIELTTAEGQRIEVLDHDFERQLARWAAIHAECSSQHVRYAWIDLSPTNNIPMRIVPLASVPPVLNLPNP
jgi:cell division septal protein FtsQ